MIVGVAARACAFLAVLDNLGCNAGDAGDAGDTGNVVPALLVCLTSPARPRSLRL